MAGGRIAEEVVELLIIIIYIYIYTGADLGFSRGGADLFF